LNEIEEPKVMFSVPRPHRTSLSPTNNRILAIFLLAVAILFSVAAFAPSTTEGAIGGTVYDMHDAVVAGAAVVVHNNGTNAEFKQTTNESGYFRVTGLTPASYGVTITAPGFSGYEAKDVIVTVGRVTEISAWPEQPRKLWSPAKLRKLIRLHRTSHPR
jgi:Carboxypeptidase regulatory-like domain